MRTMVGKVCSALVFLTVHSGTKVDIAVVEVPFLVG